MKTKINKAAYRKISSRLVVIATDFQNIGVENQNDYRADELMADANMMIEKISEHISDKNGPELIKMESIVVKHNEFDKYEVPTPDTDNKHSVYYASDKDDAKETAKCHHGKGVKVSFHRGSYNRD